MNSHLTGVKDKADICREYRLRPQVFNRWREELLERAPEIFATQPSRGDEQERIADLERMVGRLTIELEAEHVRWRAAHVLTHSVSMPGKKASNILTSLTNRKGR